MHDAAQRHKAGIISGPSLKTAGKSGGYEVAPLPLAGALPNSPIIRDMNTIWDQRKFSEARAPLAAGRIELREVFSRAGSPGVSDMPIKFPDTGYRIPAELAQYSEALQKIVDFEHAANPAAEKYYAYLTVDQKFVAAGGSQRGIGPHSDSVQGPRIVPKVEIGHTYLAVDRDPTLVYAQPFAMAAYPAEKYWLNAVFERQADPKAAVSHPPYTISLLDAYTVHTAVPAAEDGPRTLLRMVYSVQKFDRLGNTHNALFDYDWEMVPRPLPKGLIMDGGAKRNP